MKKTILVILIVLYTYNLFAGTKYYRASYRDDPSTTIVLGWSPSGTSTNAMVYYGTTDYSPDYWNLYENSHGIDRTTDHQGITSHFARLTGLQPNTIYYFVIKDDQGVSSRMSFKTLSDDPNDPICFISGGDTRTGAPIVEYQSSECRPRRQVGCDIAAKIRPDFIAFSGDFIFIPGDDGQWADWWSDWQRTIGSSETKGRVLPVVAVYGNHEQNDDIHKFFDIPNEDNYYAINMGGGLMRFYCLNTDLECDNTMLSWFESDLQDYSDNDNEPFWKVIQYHVPIAPHGEYSVLNSLINCWLGLFRDYGIRLAMEGHTHVIKITNPVVPGTGAGSDNGLIQNDAEGTVYLGEGSWGAPMRELYTSAGGKAYNWTYAQGRFPGYSIVTVSKAKIEVRTIEFDSDENLSSISQVSEDAPSGTLPNGLNYWNMTGSGDIVYTIPNTHFTFSDDASLAQLYTSIGTLSPDFSSSILSYTVTLPNGVSQVPSTFATPTHPSASYVINNAQNLTGSTAERSTEVVVTAENGESQQTYTIEFVVDAGSSDASLSSLSADIGVLSPAFSPAVFEYVLNLETGTTQIPQISATATDPEASIQINQATASDGFANVVVTSANGEASQTYTVDFVVAAADAKMITAFSISGEIEPAIINQNTHSIIAKMPVGTDVSNLSPNIEYIGAALNPESGSSQDFSSPVLYTVTAADNSTLEYTATVELVEEGNDNADLASLEIDPGDLYPVFSPDNTSYIGNIGIETDEVLITATAENPNATVRIFPAINLDGSMAQRTANVVVVAADEITSKIYSILFEKPNSIENNSGYTNSKVYPNPSTGIINIELNTNKNGAIVKIHNGFGKFIDEFKIKKGNTKSEYNLNGLSDGTYYILIFEDQNSDMHRVIKTK